MYTTAATTDDGLPEKSTSFVRLLSLSVVLVSPAFLYGLNVSFPTVAMPRLNLSIDDASWFGSVAIYVSPISSALAGVIIDKFGRKAVLIYSILPSFVGWSLLLWNYNVTVLLLGQILNGLTVGAVLYPIQVYAGECIMVRNVRLRNSCMVWIGFYASLGTFVVVGLSTFLDYDGVCRVALAMAAVMLVAFFAVIPESPAWLHLQGRTGDAEWSEKKLGIRQPILRTKSFDETVRSSPTAASVGGGARSNVFARHLKILRRPDVYKPLAILSVGGALLPFCGKVTVMMYMINIIGDTIPGQTVAVRSANVTAAASFDANAYGLVCAAFSVFGSVVSSFVLPFAGVRCMLVGSNVLTVFGLGALTFCTLNVIESVLWLRVAAISLLAFLLGVGIGPSLTVAGDMFPVDGKGYACLPAIVGNLSTATATKLFPYLYLLFDGYAYCVYAVVSLLGAVYVHVMLPEVVGKTLDQINAGFFERQQTTK